MGFVTNLLNPKIAMLYLALLPQFIDPAQGSVLTQSLVLGSIQIVISVSVNAMIALAAGSIALFLGTRPTWLLVQRWLMGTVLAGLRCGWRWRRGGRDVLPRPAAGESRAFEAIRCRESRHGALTLRSPGQAGR